MKGALGSERKESSARILLRSPAGLSISKTHAFHVLPILTTPGMHVFHDRAPYSSKEAQLVLASTAT